MICAQVLYTLKRQSHEIFNPRYNELDLFCIRLRIRRDSRKYKWNRFMMHRAKSRLRAMQHSAELTSRYAA
jgi:hypothetical protein